MYGVVWLREFISPSPQLPDQLGDGESLCEKFASFFTDKIDRIRAAVDSVPVTNFDTTRILNNLQQPHLTTSKKRVKQKLEQ